VAELERSLIVERVKAGLRNARAKGKRQEGHGRDEDCWAARAGPLLACNRWSAGSWACYVASWLLYPVPKLGKGILKRNRKGSRDFGPYRVASAFASITADVRAAAS
jgi:hypothetical protein